MFCCGPLPTVEDQNPLVVDVDQVLSDVAWRHFTATLGFCQKRSIKKQNFRIEVPENFLVFEQIEQEITPRKKANVKSKSLPVTTEGDQGKDNNRGATDTSGLMKGKVPSHRDLTNPEVVSLDTEFSNDTAEKQLYKFRFEKTRRTEINVSYQKGFTIGGKANFSIGIPKFLGDLSAEMEIETQYQVTNSEGQTFEESMVMEATSDIAVGPNSCYTANVQLEEKSLHANFKIITQLTIPQGRAPVYIKRKSDGELVFVLNVKNLWEIFVEGNKYPSVDEVKDDAGKIQADKVKFVTQGVMKGMLACNHRIFLKSDESPEIKNKAKINHFQAIKDGAVVTVTEKPVDRERENEREQSH